MSGGAGWPIGYQFRTAVAITVSDSANLANQNCVGIANKNLTTAGVVACEFYNGQTATIPIAAASYVWVGQLAKIKSTGTTAGIATDLYALYG